MSDPQAARQDVHDNGQLFLIKKKAVVALRIDPVNYLS